MVRPYHLRLVLIFSALLCALLVMTPLPLHAAAGDLDPTFGDDGKVITRLGAGDGSIAAMAIQADGKLVVAGDFGVARLLATGGVDLTFGNESVTLPTGITFRALVIQPDGKLVAAGYASPLGYDDFALARFNADGSLDSTFGGNGKVLTDFGSAEQVYALTRQPDGKLIVAGKVTADGSGDFVLARYNADGSLDSSFDGDGKVRTNVVDDDKPYALVLQPDGKIVAAGETILTYNGGISDFALVRYNADGSLDSSFDGDGKVLTDFGYDDKSYALVIQPDGKLVAAGYAFMDSSHDFTLVRYNVDGSLDSSFDGDGKVHTDFGNFDEAYALVIQPDGKLVAAGYASTSSDSNFALVRYNTDGSLDGSFDGKTVIDSGDYKRAYALVLQPDGKLVAAGSSEDGPLVARHNTDGSLDSTFDSDGTSICQLGPSRIQAIAIQPDGKLVAAGAAASGSDYDFALVRYNTDGSLDSSFDGDGQVRTDLGDFDGSDSASALVLQPDGKIVVAGSVYDGFHYADYFALVRYNVDGSLDSSFDGDGKVFDYYGIANYHASALVLQPDGKLVAAGSAITRNSAGFVLARYNPDGSLDSSFGGEGKVVTEVGVYGYAYALVLQPDGKLVAAGWTFSPAGADFVLVRYNADGSLDNTFDGDGQVRTDLGANDRAGALVLQPDGKLVVAGETFPVYTSGNSDFALVRYNTDGSLDSSFDGDGKVLTDLGGDEQAVALILQLDGRFVVGGQTTNTFALVRYNTDGSLDNSFDGDGNVLINAGSTVGTNVLVLQPDGKFVAGGQGANTFALARYLSGNTAPVAVDDLYHVGANVGLRVAAPGVLSNDSDADGNVLTVMHENGPANGRLALSIDGSFTYTPSLNFSGTDTFTYRAGDGQAISNRATIIIMTPTASERIDLLSASIQQLVANRLLNDSQGNALLIMLANAQQQLGQGTPYHTRNMLYAFLNQVTELIATGVLTPEVGQPLIDIANVIIAQVPAGSTIYLPQVSR